MDDSIGGIVGGFNTRELTGGGLKAPLEVGDSISEIIVVDNGSVDGSAEAVEQLASKIRVIRAGRNLGFGSANNLGIRNSHAEYLALVNSDAFVEKDTLQVLQRYLASDSNVGVVGPLLLNADGSCQESRFRFPTPGRAWMENCGLMWLLNRLAPRKRPAIGEDVDWLSGACLLVRREVIDGTGGFDETFFLYSEETDWQRRIRFAGWSVHFVPTARAVHLGGGSAGGASLVVREYFFEGVDRYFRKHHGVCGLILLRGATVFGVFVRGIFNWVNIPGRQTLDQAWWLLKRQLTRGFPVVVSDRVKSF